MSVDLQVLKDKLAELAVKDADCRYFGVETHRYRLAPCLTDDAVRSIERHYSIELPMEYRVFITELGNGGAGPGYGLERFGFVQSDKEIPTAKPVGPLREVQRTKQGTLSRQDLVDAQGKVVDPMEIAFFSTIRNLATDSASRVTPPSQPFSFQSLDDWEGAQANPSAGTWTLADYGCAMSARLILNGALRGQVWFDDANGSLVPFCAIANIHYADELEVFPEDRDTTFSFFQWYEHWLDHAFRQVANEYED